MKKALILILFFTFLSVVNATDKTGLITKIYSKSKPSVTFEVNRQFNCYRAEKAPVIDGKLDDDCWHTKSAATNFFVTGQKTLSGHKTVVKTCIDDKNLYISFKCYQKGKLFAAVTDNSENGHIWYDDSVEMFFDINGDGKCFYQILVNSLGKFADYRHEMLEAGVKKLVKSDKSWNSHPIIKVSQTKKFWVVEIAVPLTSMGIEKIHDGCYWKVNFTRFIRGDQDSHKNGENTNWSGLPVGSNRSPEFFGRMIMGKSACILEKVSAGAKAPGINKFYFDVCNQGRKKQKIIAELKLLSTENQFNRKVFTIKGEERKRISIPYRLEEDEEYNLNFTLKSADTGKIFTQRSFNFTTSEILLIHIYSSDYYLEDKTAKLSLKVNIGNGTRQNSEIVLKVLDDKERTLRTGKIRPVKDSDFAVLFNIEGLPVGNYKIRAGIVDIISGKTICSQEKTFEIIKGPFSL